MNRNHRALFILITVAAVANSHALWLRELPQLGPKGRPALSKWRDLTLYPGATIAVRKPNLLEPDAFAATTSLVVTSPTSGSLFRTMLEDFSPTVAHSVGPVVPTLKALTFESASPESTAPLATRLVRRLEEPEDGKLVVVAPLNLAPAIDLMKIIAESRSARTLPAVIGNPSSGSGPIVITPERVKATPKGNGKPIPAGDLDQRLCSIVGVGLSLGEALGMLSDSTGANMMLLSPVESKITIRLVNVRLAEALEHICALTGLAKLRINSTYILGAPDKLEGGYPKEWAKVHPKAEVLTTPTELPKGPVAPVDPIISRTVALSNVDAASLATSIKGALGEGKITAVAGPGSLMPSLIDRETGGTTGVSQGVVQSGAVSKTLILRGPESLVEEALKLVKELDTPRAQVAISVTISDVTDSGLKELGLNWTLGGFTVGESNNKGVNFGTFTRTGTSFAAAIKGLETVDKAKLLASPSVSVMDGQRAFVLIGSRLKFPEVVGYSTNGNPIITTKEERVGVYLQVAPEVATDGTITLSLYPQVSTVVGFTEIGGGSYPQIDSREAQTTLRVKSGDTVVIGGLYKNEELEKIQQIPLLSRIPILGELFKSRKKTKAASQVIISLSLKLVGPEQQ